MKIIMRSDSKPPELQEAKRIAFVGHALDDRGRAAEAFIKSNAETVVKIEYLPEAYTLRINNTEEVEADIFPDFFKSHFLEYDEITIEATTLGFPEIFLCSRASILEHLHKKLTFIYVEPEEYRRVEEEQARREFDLSEECGPFLSIPGAIINIDDLNSVKKAIFFVGYEGNRLDRIYEELEKKPAERCVVVFGVPAFKAGWEMNSFSKNINVLRERSITDGLEFFPANNPLVAYQILEEHFSNLHRAEKMVVSPLGTKPASIGAALFVAEKSTIENGARAGILFDNPKRKADRSSKIHKWHHFKIGDSNGL